MITDVPLFRFKRGGHVCVFYYDETTLIEFLVPYICEGLRAGEKCFLVQPKSIIDRLPFALSVAGFSFRAEVERKAIELYNTEDVYLKGGDFDVASMMKHLEDAIDSALSAGFKGLRTAGDLGWAAAANLPHDTLLLYEKMVQRSFPNRPAVGICQYPVQVFPAELLEKVLESHQASLQQPRNDAGH